MPPSARSVDEPVEEVELPLRVGAVLGLLAVGHGQVGPDALETQQRLGQHRGRDGRQVLGRRADPVHPGVDLDVHGDGPARRPPPR